MTYRKLLPQVLLILFAATLAVGADKSAPPKLNGSLDKIESIRVLRVWGTPHEMGFAHGYLVGQGIMDYLTESLDAVPPDQRAKVDKARLSLVKVIHMPDTVLAEIRGLLDGISAAQGGTPLIKPLKRPLQLDDLILMNATDTLRAFGCSGFTLWGERAGDAGVITARNFDFSVPGPKTLRQQMILVRRPTGKRQVAMVTFPGYLAAVTGINEDGVCTFVHDGTGGRIRRPQGRYTPLGIVLTGLLETSGPKDVHGRAESILKDITPYPFSYMVRIITPRVSDTAPPVRVFHIDRKGLGENAVGNGSCITTNHYVNEGLTAGAEASEGSRLRYRRLDKRITRSVTDEKAWASLKAVAASGRFPTLHSLVVYPERRELDIGFAKWKKGKIRPAPKRKPKRITFDQLFKPGE